MSNTFSHAEKPNFENLQQLKDENNSFLLGRTGFRFLDDHFGLRPGCLHILHARRSAGKTSLVRSILCNIAEKNKVIWYASEETQDQWKLKFEIDKLPNVENIRFISEKSLVENDEKFSENEMLRILEMHIETFEAKVLVFDNLTTSLFYNDKKVDVQNKIIMKLKHILQRHGCAMFGVAHDNNDDGRGGPVTSSNVRGSKTLPNLAEYWYNLHRLRLSDADSGGSAINLSIIHVDKCRQHSTSDHAYQLIFNRRTNYYREDKPISWGVAKELFEKQIKIGGKK